MGLENFNYIVPWAKFRKVSTDPTGIGMDAETVTEYSSKKIKAGRNGNAIVFVSAEVNIYVNIHRSWVIRGKANTYLLQHEQGHYDISAIAARSFYNGILKLTGVDINALNEAMKTFNNDLQAKINNTDIRYDTRTDHSRNKTEQDKWNKAIEAEKKNAYGSLDNLPS